MKSPIEEFAEARKSGAYHPETVKNWPEKTEKVLTAPPEPSPIHEEIPEEVRINTNPHEEHFWWLAMLTVIILVLSICVILLHADSHSHEKDTAPKAQIKRPKRKIKKVSAQRPSDEARRKACYERGDWNACLAYKDNLPLRARVGRTDLY